MEYTLIKTRYSLKNTKHERLPVRMSWALHNPDHLTISQTMFKFKDHSVKHFFRHLMFAYMCILRCFVALHMTYMYESE